MFFVTITTPVLFYVRIIVVLCKAFPIGIFFIVKYAAHINLIFVFFLILVLCSACRIDLLEHNMDRVQRLIIAPICENNIGVGHNCHVHNGVSGICKYFLFCFLAGRVIMTPALTRCLLACTVIPVGLDILLPFKSLHRMNNHFIAIISMRTVFISILTPTIIASPPWMYMRSFKFATVPIMFMNIVPAG